MPTPTSSPTPTPRATPTPTPTPTPSPTPTLEPTATPTPTAWPTPTERTRLGGNAHFRDANATSDSLVIDFTGASTLSHGSTYEGWLIDAGNNGVSTGRLGRGPFLQGEYVSPSGTNLLAHYSTFVITVEPLDDPDPSPSGIVAYTYEALAGVLEQTVAPTSTPTATPTPHPTPTAAPMPTPRPTPTATPTPPPGFNAAEYFSGKTVHIVANSSPGGGADTQGRVMAAFMSEYIPGNPLVVFTNQPNKLPEYIYSATEAPKDGTYISWNSTPQLDFGFNEDTQFIKRSSFQALGATIDPTRAWMTYDPVGNLGASAADSCLWDYAGQSGTGGGAHGEFLLADELSDIAEGSPTLLASVFAAEQLDVPFRYFGFDTVDTNAVRLMWARGDINSTVRASLWYRFPVENPDWIPSGLMRAMAGMGPGQLKGNAQTEPHCGDVRDHLDDDQTFIFNSLMAPTNYASMTLWLPPGTPDHIADALSTAFEEAMTTDEELIAKYGAVAGEPPGWTGRTELQAATLENEELLQGSQQVIEEQKARLLPKYFAEYVNG